MNKHILALATVTALAMVPATAHAFEIGESSYLDNTFEYVYSIENTDFEATFETELGTALTKDITIYALAEVDLRKEDFTGLELGVDYAIPEGHLIMTGAVLLDSNLEYTDVELRAEIKF